MDRNKAIEYIRWYFTEDDGMAADASVKEAIQVLVPELRESEDERIWKAIDEIMSLDKAWDIAEKHGLTAADIRRWVKKQKEQKPINRTELNWKDINKLEVLINNVLNEYPNGIGQESFGKEVLERFREYKEDEDLDGKEQKPDENITDEEIKQAVDDIHNFKVAVTDLAKTFNIRIDHDRDIDWHNFCASLLTYLKKHQPDDWKPTEEQLNALYLASYGGELSSVDCLELDSLLIDLRKKYNI